MFQVNVVTREEARDVSLSTLEELKRLVSDLPTSIVSVQVHSDLVQINIDDPRPGQAQVKVISRTVVGGIKKMPFANRAEAEAAFISEVRKAL